MKEFSGKKVIIMCCSSCNMSCEHCYVSYKGNRKPSELLEIVKQLKNKYEVVLNGAEVLTNLGYLDSYKELEYKIKMMNEKPKEE